MPTPFGDSDDNVKSFTCPTCFVFSVQRLFYLYRKDFEAPGQAEFNEQPLYFSKCSNCGSELLFQGDRIVLPEGTNSLPPANSDLSESIQEDYREAGSIYQRSPRGACALLRLAVQKLCVQLGHKGENLNDDIARLVELGLPIEIQQALDALRVIGNNAVHPAELDLRDDKQTAESLFVALNMIADRLVTQKKRMAELFQKLPVSAREQIVRRGAPKIKS